MAASSKPTAVHFSLVFFVMVCLILSVVVYLKWADATEFQRQLQAETDRANDFSSALDRNLAQVQELKEQFGSPNASDGGQGATGSLWDEINAAMTSLGREQARGTVRETMAAMRTEIDNKQNQNSNLAAGQETQSQRALDAESNAQDRVDVIQGGRDDSERQLRDQIDRYSETVAEKDAMIQRWQDDFRAMQAEKEELADELRRARQEWEENRHLLNEQITFLSDQVQELTNVSFERQDGRIVNVDNNTRTVWINLGHLDNLKEQVTFSVYTRDHRGIGRGVEDIKAKIEITRVLGPHIAEARILEEDLDRPIGENDPIYSPLWSAGRTEYFAIVGRPDLDEDGDGDWDQFYEIVHNAGGEVDLIVNTEGLREPADASLSSRTKFLIVGDLDDPADFSGRPEEQDLAKRVLDEREALIDESRLYGIRVVRLNDFLDYIGFRPQQRLWHPGEEREFNLVNGARSASVDEALEQRASSGTVSELFRENRGRSSSDESSGTTSGLFRN